MKKVLSVVLCAGMITTPLLSSSCFADDVTAKVNSQTLATQTAEDKQEQVAEPVVESKDTDEYMKQAIKDTEDIHKAWEKAKNNTERQKIVQAETVNVDAQLNSYTNLLNKTTNKSQKTIIEKRMSAINFKKDFLNQLSKNTGRTWKRILFDLVIHGGLFYFLFNGAVNAFTTASIYGHASCSDKLDILQCLDFRNIMSNKADRNNSVGVFLGVLGGLSLVKVINLIKELLS